LADLVKCQNINFLGHARSLDLARAAVIASGYESPNWLVQQYAYD
jgi:hypothetical protein